MFDFNPAALLLGALLFAGYGVFLYLGSEKGSGLAIEQFPPFCRVLCPGNVLMHGD